MKKNIGIVDRILRLVVVVAVAVLYFTGVIHAALAIILGIIAVVLLATSLVGTCPLYLACKLSSKGNSAE